MNGPARPGGGKARPNCWWANSKREFYCNATVAHRVGLFSSRLLGSSFVFRTRPCISIQLGETGSAQPRDDSIQLGPPPQRERQ